MKSYILFAILIGLGASQIVVTSQSMCGCTQLTNQNDCNTLPGCQWTIANSCTVNSCIGLKQSACLEASEYCQWYGNNGKCQAFTSCANLSPTNNMNISCVQQNVRCIGFNTSITPNQCVSYSDVPPNCSGFLTSATCNYNFSKQGPCLYSNGICQAYNQCSQAQTPDQCQQLNQYKSATTPEGILCQYTAQQGCQPIISCGQFNSSDTCKYYFSNLNSITLNVCQWNANTNPPSCVSVTSPTQLTESTCLSNTGFLFRWYALQSNPNYGFCGPCKQIQIPTNQISIQTSSKCACTDYMLQTDCNSQNGLCQWNTNTGTCSLSQCNQITYQNICIQVANCYWSINTSQCQTLNNCTDLKFQVNAVGCAAQSIQCAGYQGGNCISTSNVTATCGDQTPQTCSQFISSQGLCVLNVNGSCSVLQYCNQINDSAFCGNWQNQCIWDAAASICQQITCASITNEKSCTHVITQFSSTQYQLCRWNKSLGTQGGCENAYSALLQTSTTCVNNTGNTFRWSTSNASAGMCVSCGTNQLSLQTPSSCQCSQLYSQENCNNSGFCTYNTLTKICSPSTCTQYENQITCASLSTCYWNSTNGCLPFTSCSALPAANQLECVNMNVSCKGFSNNFCQSFPTSTCTAQYTAGGGCYNNTGTDGVCFLTTTGLITQCTGFSQCSQAPTETFCLRNQLSCSWNALTKCTQVNCTSFKTQLNCKFYLPNPFSSEVIPCLWNSTTGTCSAASDIQTQLTQNNCASSTHNTYSWVTVSTNKGYCVRCQEQITLSSQCTCSYLTQLDCSQALQCNWSNGSCSLLECTQILQQTVCASQIGCQWNNNQCTIFTTGCNSLLGKSQAQCMAQNVYCVGSNGTNCSKTYNKCEANTQDTSCVASLGSDGACYWNSQAVKCMAVNTCNQLPESACKLRSKSCYWDITNFCQTLTCQTLYQQYGQCTFITNLSNINNVQSCNMINNQCVQIADPLSLTQDQCFTNSNKTARWVPKTNGTGGTCFSCSTNLIPVYSAQTCQCYQYMTQSECYGSQGQSCVWSGSKCTEKACSNIFSNLACAQTIGCGWNATTSACENFTSCNSITAKGLAIQNCLSYSIQCKGYNGTNCTQYPNQLCSTLTTPDNCSGNLGTDGPCIWNTNVPAGTLPSCVALTTCSQINNHHICSYYSNVCQYTTSCQQLTCASFTSPASCRYVVTSFTTGEVQQCQWSTNTGTCINLITSSQLNSVTCSANTGFTYRWVPSRNGNGEGYCTKCVLNSLYVPGQCACNQLIFPNDCIANLQCSWSTATTTPSCYNKPCNQIGQQAACSSNPRCSWSAAQGLCQPFSSCSDLAGINAGECASYSVFCAAISTTYLPLQQRYICSATTSQSCSVETPTGTAGTTTPSECENIYVAYGICQYNSTTKSCAKITQCSQITSQLRCQRLVHSCFWQLPTGDATTGSCVATKCTNINNKLECTYVLDSLATPSNSGVTQCIWQSANGCTQATSILTTLQSSNCYSNTLMMSRWVPTSTLGETGYCAVCSQYSTKTSIKSPCSCKILSQYECSLASPQCSYNATSSTCSTTTCSSITSKNSCAANPNCIFLGTTCVSYGTSPSTTVGGCTNITTATSAFECYTASVNCPQFIPNTTTGQPGTCGTAQSCSKQSTQTTCDTYNSQVAADYCVWNNSTGKCQTINNCKMISDVALCSLQTNRCQWSVVLNSCITQSCNSYTSQSDCTYVYTSYSPGDVALCYWDSLYNDCRSASLQYADTYNQTNSTQCFVNTGHVYHLDGNDCTRCFENILSILLIAMLLILI